LRTLVDLHVAIVYRAAKRLRPKFMTVAMAHVRRRWLGRERG
jgi:hypothetical protein